MVFYREVVSWKFWIVISAVYGASETVPEHSSATICMFSFSYVTLCYSAVCTVVVRYYKPFLLRLLCYTIPHALVIIVPLSGNRLFSEL